MSPAAASGSGSSSSRLAVALYRATLKWGRQAADVPFTLRSGDLLTLAPSLRGSLVAAQAQQLDAGAAVASLARAAFEACRGAQGEAAAEALDHGVEAVRLLHTTYAASLAEMRQLRQDRADRAGVKFSVGQVSGWVGAGG